ncbi:MAG: translation elongation factor-like protein [Deltaproteobacteria bacterium]|nr:translation elongation factor-like protein [Deltaproteobacteria bacterium]
MFFDFIKNRIIGKKTQKETPQKKKIKLLPVGVVMHYYGKIEVAIIEVQENHIELQDVLFIKGSSTRFRQRVRSIEYNHEPISKAPAGYQIGMKVGARVRTGDKVYKELS